MLANAYIPTEGMSTQSKLFLNYDVILDPDVTFSFSSLFPLSFLNSA